MSVVKAITFLGSNGVLWTVIAAATVILAIRRRWRLAAYLLVTGAGALILDPILKSLVGRRWLFLIPAIAMPVLVALSRMYRGEHHPTDILASLLFSGLWLTATVLLIKHNGAEVSSHDEQTARAEAGTMVRSAKLLCRFTTRAGQIDRDACFACRAPPIAAARPAARRRC